VQPYQQHTGHWAEQGSVTLLSMNPVVALSVAFIGTESRAGARRFRWSDHAAIATRVPRQTHASMGGNVVKSYLIVASHRRRFAIERLQCFIVELWYWRALAELIAKLLWSAVEVTSM
jgi:hypothetical protein